MIYGKSVFIGLRLWYDKENKEVMEGNMSIGYACLTVGVPDTTMRSCRIQNASEERLTELILHNLNSLENLIDYNIRNNIKLFRISSDIIPFGSSPVNTLKWWENFQPQFSQIESKIKQSGMRISMHPGQYTVLNSPSEDVVQRAMDDLNYHTRLLRSLGADARNKLILHIGGVYGDKALAMERFISNYNRLDEAVKQHLVIENDDRSYTIQDVLAIGEKAHIPVVFDNLHHAINQWGDQKVDLEWINRCKQTWKKGDGRQKIHYSQQDPEKKPGGHSKTTGINEFMAYYEAIGGKEIDIMLEVKDKNLSAVKCINATRGDKKINQLEREWSLYKYTILEKSPNNYKAIRQLLKDKMAYPAVEFYNLIEEAMNEEMIHGNYVNGAQHVWGYFKTKASDTEKEKFQEAMEKYQQKEIPFSKIKSMLKKLAIKYHESYLLESYYFVL